MKYIINKEKITQYSLNKLYIETRNKFDSTNAYFKEIVDAKTAVLENDNATLKAQMVVLTPKHYWKFVR